MHGESVGLQPLVPERLRNRLEWPIERGQPNLIQQHAHEHIRSIVTTERLHMWPTYRPQEAADEVPYGDVRELLHRRQHQIYGVVTQCTVVEPRGGAARADETREPARLCFIAHRVSRPPAPAAAPLASAANTSVSVTGVAAMLSR